MPDGSALPRLVPEPLSAELRRLIQALARRQAELDYAASQARKGGKSVTLEDLSAEKLVSAYAAMCASGGQLTAVVANPEAANWLYAKTRRSNSENMPDLDIRPS